MKKQTKLKLAAVSATMLIPLLSVSAQQRVPPGWSKIDRFLGAPIFEKSPYDGEDEGEKDQGGGEKGGAKGAASLSKGTKEEKAAGSLELKGEQLLRSRDSSASLDYQFEAVPSLSTSILKLTNFQYALTPEFLQVADSRPVLLKTTRTCASSGLWEVGELPNASIESDILNPPPPSNPDNPPNGSTTRKASVATTGVMLSNGCPTIGTFVKYANPNFPYDHEGAAAYKRIASRVTLKSNGTLLTDRISPSTTRNEAAGLPGYLRRDAAHSSGTYPNPAFLGLAATQLPSAYMTASVIPLGMGASGRDIYGSAAYVISGQSRFQTQAFWFDQGSNDLGNFSSAQFTHLSDLESNESNQHCGWSSAAYGQTEGVSPQQVYGFGTEGRATTFPSPNGPFRDRCQQGQRKAVVFPLAAVDLPPVNSPDGNVLNNHEVIATSPDGSFKVMNYLDNQQSIASAQILDGSRSSSPETLRFHRDNENPSQDLIRTQAEDMTIGGNGLIKVYGTRFIDSYPQRSEAVVWNQGGQLEAVIGDNLAGRGTVDDMNEGYYAPSLETRAAVRSSSGRDIVVGTAFTTNVDGGSARAGFSCTNARYIETTFDSEYLPERRSREAWIWDGTSAPRSLEEYALEKLPRDAYGEAVRSQLASWELCEAHDVMHLNGVTVVIGEGIHHPQSGPVRRKGFMLVLGKIVKENLLLNSERDDLRIRLKDSPSLIDRL